MARRRIEQAELPIPTTPAPAPAPVVSDRSDTEVPQLGAWQGTSAIELSPSGHDLQESTTLSPLEKAHEAMRLRREQGIKPVKLDPREKARRKPTSLRLAVTAKCWDCVNGAVDPLPRARIRDCSCLSCPLHPVRPFQNVKSGKPGEEHEDEGEGEELDVEETGT